jgi:MFS family permease
VVDEEGAVTRIRLLRPLRHRQFRLLWTGMSLSLLGDGALLVALAWQAYQLHDRPSAMSVVGVALTLPQLLFVLVGGVLSDRMSRRSVMLVADLVRGGVLAALAVLAWSDLLQLWHLVVFAVVYGAASAFFVPAFEALVPEVVPEDELTEANALDQFVRPAALWLLGPALGGWLIGVGGTGSAFALDAATFLLSAACLLRVVVPGRAGEPEASGDDADEPGLMTELREGFSYVRRQPWLWATFVAATFTYLLFLGPTEVLLPYLIKHELGGDAHDVGLVLSAGGVAALVAALVIGQTGLPRRRMLFTYVVWSVATAAVAGYGLAHSRVEAMLAAMVVTGFEAVGAVAWVSTKQRLVPGPLLGRVASFDWFISIALVPVSYAVTAPVAAALGVRTTLVGAGVLGAVVTLAFLAVPGVRAPDRRDADGDPVPLEANPEQTTEPVTVP